MAPLAMQLSTLVLAVFVSALAAGAQASAPHLGVAKLSLGELAQLPEGALQLAVPCLGCQAKLQVSLRPSPEPAATPAAATPTAATPAGATPAGATPAALRAQRLSNALYIGDTWRFRGGRELSLHLTPNEAHCAPLMRLTF